MFETLPSSAEGVGSIPGQEKKKSLVRELGSHVPHGLGARAWSRGDIVVNSVETLKKSTSKEKQRIV